MAEVLASLGSNQNREHNIRSAVKALRACFGELRLSSVYNNKAVGFVGEDFLNMVVAFDSDRTPQEVQQSFHQIEASHGRVRHGEKFAPRQLDIDLILYGDMICDDGSLKLPRIDIVEYAFVLLPLAELVPHGAHPVLKISYSQMWRDYVGDRDLQAVDLSFE